MEKFRSFQLRKSNYKFNCNNKVVPKRTVVKTESWEEWKKNAILSDNNQIDCETELWGYLERRTSRQKKINEKDFEEYVDVSIAEEELRNVIENVNMPEERINITELLLEWKLLGNYVDEKDLIRYERYIKQEKKINDSDKKANVNLTRSIRFCDKSDFFYLLELKKFQKKIEQLTERLTKKNEIPEEMPQLPLQNPDDLSDSDSCHSDNSNNDFTYGKFKIQPIITEESKENIIEDSVITILKVAGFERVTEPALDVLKDIYKDLMSKLSKLLHHYHQFDLQFSGKFDMQDALEKSFKTLGLGNFSDIINYIHEQREIKDKAIRKSIEDSTLYFKLAALYVKMKEMNLEDKSECNKETDDEDVPEYFTVENNEDDETQDVPEIHFSAESLNDNALQSTFEPGLQMLQEFEKQMQLQEEEQNLQNTNSSEDLNRCEEAEDVNFVDDNITTDDVVDEDDTETSANVVDDEKFPDESEVMDVEEGEGEEEEIVCADEITESKEEYFSDSSYTDVSSSSDKIIDLEFNFNDKDILLKRVLSENDSSSDEIESDSDFETEEENTEENFENAEENEDNLITGELLNAVTLEEILTKNRYIHKMHRALTIFRYIKTSLENSVDQTLDSTKEEIEDCKKAIDETENILCNLLVEMKILLDCKSSSTGIEYCYDAENSVEVDEVNDELLDESESETDVQNDAVEQNESADVEEQNSSNVNQEIYTELDKIKIEEIKSKLEEATDEFEIQHNAMVQEWPDGNQPFQQFGVGQLFEQVDPLIQQLHVYAPVSYQQDSTISESELEKLRQELNQDQLQRIILVQSKLEENENVITQKKKEEEQQIEQRLKFEKDLEEYVQKIAAERQTSTTDEDDLLQQLDIVSNRNEQFNNDNTAQVIQTAKSSEQSACEAAKTTPPKKVKDELLRKQLSTPPQDLRRDDNVN